MPKSNFRKFFLLSIPFLLAIPFSYKVIPFCSEETPLEDISSLQLPEINNKYGVNLNNYHLVESEVKPNEYLADLLAKYHVPYSLTHNLVEKTKSVFDVRKLRAGKKYAILASDPTQPPEYFVYEPNPFEYFRFWLKDSIGVEKIAYPIEKKQRIAGGVIHTSLWNAMMAQDMDYGLAVKLEDAYGWTIDFHHIQPGDFFKVVYEELYVDGQKVGTGEVSGALFNNYGKDFYAIAFANGKYDGFYNPEGRPMKKAFLRAPLKYTRISSSYNLRRFHPVLKRVKPHLGTDYAAPYGTPIFAVANGVVTKAGRTRGNGNYVKIKHDKTYTSQYLHMQSFARGITTRVHVKQNQVIGYVGSTGLATGPHVCFRFWKNGKQVNHLRENLPEPEPMPDSDLPEFYRKRDLIKGLLDEVMVSGETLVQQ